MRFTVIMPIHNEATMLLKTLPSIMAIHPDELLVGLDRNTDGGEDIIYEYIRRNRPPSLRCLSFKRYNSGDGAEWGFRGAYLRRDLYRLASNDAILNTSADLHLDPRIQDYIGNIPKYGLVSFGYWDYPWNYQCFMRRLISDHSPIHGFAGLLAFSKEAWIRSEDLEDLKRVKRAEDTHLHLAIKKIALTRHINTGTIHLRPREDPQSQYNRGVAQWQMLHSPLLKPFIHSVVMLRPHVFAGYMHARRGLV